ncbi:MAG: acetyltransferase [Gammaproteobacteria bacterium]|nr:acetyltransferase [Gammaproteobacteria bacterium]
MLRKVDNSPLIKIILLGGHGDGLVVAQTIQDICETGQSVKLVGFLNDRVDVGATIDTIPVLGKISEWKTLDFDETYSFHPALHKVKDMHRRVAYLEGLNIPDDRFVTLVHPTAVIADSAKIGKGCFIGSHVTIQPGAIIGSYCSIRAGANIGHDTVIEDFCYIGPNSTMTGNSILKKGAHLGPNAVISDGITLENYTIAGAGAVIIQKTDRNAVYIGNPARKIMTYHKEVYEEKVE